MSKDRLIAIIVACVVVIALVIVIATHSPEGTKEPEQIQVSAHDFATQLFAELTDVRREQLWEEHEGKQVRWTNEPWSIRVEEDSLVVYFTNPLDYGRTTGIMAVFHEDQRSSLLEISEDDLVVYTGVLTSYEESYEHATIYLRDCAVVSIITPKLLWWNSELEDTYTTFAKSDPYYIYVLVLERAFRYPDKPRVSGALFGVALNRASGQVAGRDDLGEGLYSLRDLRFKSYDYEGITYKSFYCISHAHQATECTILKAVDRRTGSVLWMRTLHGSGIYDYHIAHGILYISTAEGVGAFELPVPAELQSQND